MLTAVLIDSPELFHGVPVSLQLVEKHHRDEELLEAAKLF
jgi:Asp-tRNA(Asn)/Glu-tRNA(Gln) amidotransferase A subunit family amidase